MPHRFLAPYIDAVVGTITTAATTLIASLLISESSGTLPRDVNELRMLLLPLLGGLIMSGGLMMLNPNPETRRITIGRGIIALFLGSAVPSIFALIYPPLEYVVIHPIALLFWGGIATGIIYVLSRPFTARLYERSDAISRRLEHQLEKRLHQELDDADKKTD